MKKFFIISTITLVLVLLFLGVYNFSFKNNSPIVKEDGAENKNSLAGNLLGAEKAENNKKIFSVSDKKAASPALSQEKDKLLYHSLEDGSLFSFSLDDETEKLVLKKNIAGLTDAIWSPNSKKEILRIKNGEKTSFLLYDYASGKETAIKDGVDNVYWVSLGNKIVYKYFNQETMERTINISDPDGSNWKKIIDTKYRNISMSLIPGTALVAAWNYPNSFEETSLITINTINDEVKNIFSGAFGADYLWSPDGKWILASLVEAKGGAKVSLSVLSGEGGNLQKLQISTIASKCVWARDNKTIYYAVPGAIGENAVMPNDYQEEKIKTKDTFWKIDITTGKKERIVELDDLEKSGGNFDAASLLLSPDEDILFFINRADQKLYGIKLDS